MKKVLLTSVFCLYLFCVSAQCVINPFVQQNYEKDARTLALFEIITDTDDPDHDNPFVPQERVDFHLEKLSALYENPNNIPEIDSIFNEFQYHVQYNPSFKEISFRVETSVSWVQPLKNTGISGVQQLDDLLANFQLTVESFVDYNSCSCTWFKLKTTHDFLNMNALVDDLESIQDISVAEVLTEGDLLNYTGIPYNLIKNLINPQGGFTTHPVEVCNIAYNESTGGYEFYLGADFCLSGCIVSRYWYASVSDDCNEVNFSRTLSTENVALENMAIYPNPTSAILQLQGITNIKSVEIYSILGQNMETILMNSKTIDVHSLQNGVYFLKVIDDQNRTTTRKFVKK